MNARNVFAGLLIVLGFGFLLNQFNIWNFGSVISNWWPVLLIIFGIFKLSTDRNSIFFGLMLFVIGALLLADNLFLLPWGFWSAFWPLLLIIGGLSLLSSKRKHLKKMQVDADVLNEFVIMGGVEKIVDNQNFQGGTATAVMGGIVIDLRQASIAGESAFIDLTAIMGGIEIRVPHNWKIEIQGTPILGGMDNKTRLSYDDEIASILKIRYSAIMGGVEIKN